MPQPHHSPDDNSLEIVFSRFERHTSFSPEIFTGFSSLRVLTYTASIPMIVDMLNQFETVECVFGFEGVLAGLSHILASQRFICEELTTAIQGLEDQRKRKILEYIHLGKARFFVMRGAISHSKLYLLESPTKRLVITGSANWSKRAFSGKQSEELVAFENDDKAWAYFERRYRQIRERATLDIASPTLVKEVVRIEDVPLIQHAQEAKEGLTVFVHSPSAQNVLSLPRVLHTVERLSDEYKHALPSLAQPKNGRIQFNAPLADKVVQLVKSRKQKGQEGEEPTWLSINKETRNVFLTGQAIPLAPEWSAVESDVQCLIEYFENFRQGFVGDIAQHQRDYFLFLCWFYCSPFVCDFRNDATIQHNFLFDFPQFAVLYGKSNCGKSKLVETLMKSMFGHYTCMDKVHFTRTNLQALRDIRRRFPVVFDDIDKKRFTDHATELIKDEGYLRTEYPAFILSMNAEDHSFSTEIYKRCLMIYTRASLPGYNVAAARSLHKSVTAIQNRLTTALYHEYLRRMLDRLAIKPLPSDMLHYSSEIVTNIFTQASSSPLPHWCRTLTIDDYQGRAYDKIRTELKQLYLSNPSIWKIGRSEIVLLVPGNSRELHRIIPDWILKEGSKAGTIILDRPQLESFLQMSFRRAWLQRFFPKNNA
ncbi:phospholipase D family protein [Ktedonobacter robiniae]|uniref:PLD phosphodiesterase domain-containing protein n=1 Tax=Ktedonobacter robiniae TaxID=2778365 RepID=A0ABQ3V314_9CHLR|nr:phospholipase D family protein [Ktedonobacter robiniae]GHO59280.1 hypothetical protein KSB_77550 [Ktedonobacter robiniae]